MTKSSETNDKMFTFSLTFGPYRLSYFAYLIRNIVFKLLITIIKFSRPHFLKPFPSLSSRYNLLSSFVQKLHNRRFLLMFHFFFFSSETCQYFLYIRFSLRSSRQGKRLKAWIWRRISFPSYLDRDWNGGKIWWRYSVPRESFIYLLIQFFFVN